MATVTGITAEKAQEIEDASVISGSVSAGGDLILTKGNGAQINAGPVIGPEGPTGPQSTGEGVSVKDFGALGDGVADDTAEIQAAIDSVVAAGGGVVFLPKGTYKTSAQLVINASNVVLAGAGWASVISYTGNGVAILLGNSTSGTVISGIRLAHFRIAGNAGATRGIRAVGVQFSRFENLRIDGFSALNAIGLMLDTQSTGFFNACINNTIWGGYISGCYNGVKFTKDAADTGSDGCNHNSIYGLRVATFSGIGIDIDAGENNALYGVDSSSANDATTGIRVNDDVTGLYQVRTDCSFGPPNTAVGILITANGRDHIILNPTGNGPNEMIKHEAAGISGIVMRDGFNVWYGNVRRNLTAIGEDKWVARTWKNGGASNIAATEVAFFDTTCAEGEVKRHAFASTSQNPMVAVEAIVVGASGGFAEPGSVVNVAVDATDIEIGDQLVPSTTVNGRARRNNVVTDARQIIGVARTAKAGGANGLVKCYIR